MLPRSATSRSACIVALLAALMASLPAGALPDPDTSSSVPAGTGSSSSSTPSKNGQTAIDDGPDTNESDNTESAIPQDQGWILVDATNNRVLEAANEDIALPSSTLMKIFTVLVAAEHFSEDERLTVSDNAANQPAPNANLGAGDEWKVLDLIAAVMLPGAVDATVALADGVATRANTTYEAAAAGTAARIGLSGTSAATATGKGEDTTTARDMAVIANNLMSMPAIAEIAKTLVYRTTDPNGYAIRFDNSNGIVSILADSVGLFTSGRPESGAGIIAVTERDGRRLIAVAIGVSNPFQKVSTLLANAPKEAPSGAAAFPKNTAVPFSVRDQIARAMPQVLGGGRPGSGDPADAPALSSANSTAPSSAVKATTKGGGDDGIGFGTMVLLLLLAGTVAIVVRREQVKARKRRRRVTAMRMYEKERRYLDVYRPEGEVRLPRNTPVRPATKTREYASDSGAGHVRLVRDKPKR